MFCLCLCYLFRNLFIKYKFYELQDMKIYFEIIIEQIISKNQTFICFVGC